MIIVELPHGRHRVDINRLDDLPEMGSPTEGCGHFLPEECPNELAAVILSFWCETL